MNDSTKDMFSRRQFLGTGSAVPAAAEMLTVADTSAQDQKQNPPKFLPKDLDYARDAFRSGNPHPTSTDGRSAPSARWTQTL
jgi:hypothetical protein